MTPVAMNPDGRGVSEWDGVSQHVGMSTIYFRYWCPRYMPAWHALSAIYLKKIALHLNEWSSRSVSPYGITKAPFTQGCDLRATLERPEKWSGRSVVAQTQNVLFLCNCCSTTLVPSLNDQSCCNGATGRAKEAEWRQNHCQGGWRVAVVAEWRHSGRHCDRSMEAVGRPKEAQWWYKEGRSVARIDTQCSQHTYFLRGDQWPATVHPFCHHGDVCAFLLPPLSDLWATSERIYTI